MITVFQRFVANFTTGKVRREVLNGRSYVVVPCAMAVEGILNGSSGPLLYLNEDLKKNTSNWDHKPVVINHPEMNGQPVSASSKDVLEKHQAGFLLNTSHDNKLRAETWLDEDKTNKLEPRLIPAIEKGQQIEVSTGLFVDVEQSEGVWNGEKYKGIARNYRPDHLAIIYDKVGASSVAAGAGLLANQQQGTTNMDPEILALIQNKQWTEDERHNHPREDFGDPDREAFPIHDQDDLHNAASLLHHAKNPTQVKGRLKKIAKRKGLEVPKSWSHDDAEMTKNELYEAVREGQMAILALNGPIMIHNVLSHQDTHSSISEAMNATFGGKDGYWPGYVEDVYDKFYVYKHEGSHYKAGYEYDDKNKKLSIDHPSQHSLVTKHTEYKNAAGETVAEKHQTPIAAEIKQPQSVIPGHGKHELPGSGGKVIGTSDKPGAHANNSSGVTNNMATETSVVAVAVTPAGLLANASAEERELLQDALESRERERGELVKIIVNAKGGSFKEEDLKKKTTKDLRELASFIINNTPVEEQPRRPGPGAYLGAGGVPPLSFTTNAEPAMPEPYSAPTINFAANGTGKK